MIRLSLLAIVVIAVGSILLGLSWGTERADAGNGVSFAIGVNADGDGDNDCGTGVPMAVGNGAPDPAPAQVSNTTCTLREGGTFKANVYLIDNGGLAVAGLSAHVVFSGATSTGRGDSVWDACAFEGTAFGADFENTGCAIGLPPAEPLDIVGLVATFTFRCTADGSLTLSNTTGETALTDAQLEEHSEGSDDLLTIDCQEGVGAAAGDSDCNGTVNSIDAALILQNTAGLLQNIPCADGADADGNGTINSIDAALILQFSAGLIDEL
jgi:hypothetical protein